MAKKVIVVGAGAAGLMAAGQASMRGCDVWLIERNPRPARKLMITGKGRCNVTNACDINEYISNVPTNGRFMFSSICSFTPDDTITFFEELGVPLKIERGNRVFPVSDKAVDIVDALVTFCRRNGVKTVTARCKEVVVKEGKACGVLLDDGSELSADSVIVCTGGKSYPQTGSTGDGYSFAEAVGHTVTPLHPSLVPLEVHEGWCTELMGLSLKNVSVRFYEDLTGKTVYEDFGEMLFTHFGVSGPVILSASSHLRDMSSGKYKLSIDLKPALSHEKLDERILRDFSSQPNRVFANSLSALLPAKLIPVAVRLSGIPAGLKVNQVTKDMRLRFGALIKRLELTITGFRPIEEAIITSGGVSVNQIDPKTMQSKLVKGLYFAGEVIDVDAYTGGFNLQAAFSTGFVAGRSQEEY